jgi:hypothetical protein
MKAEYQAPTLQLAGTFQDVTEGYGGYGGKKWKKYFGFGFGKKFYGFKKYGKYEY